MEYQEQMNIYRKQSSIFFAVFGSVVLLLVTISTEKSKVNFIFMGITFAVMLSVYLYYYFSTFKVGHSQKAIVFSWRKQQQIALIDIDKISIENLDYFGKFGGYGKRVWGKKHAYIFNDSGNFLCIQANGKDYYLTIQDNVYWKKWIEEKNIIPIKPID